MAQFLNSRDRNCSNFKSFIVENAERQGPRCRMALYERRVMEAVLYIRKHDYPKANSAITAWVFFVRCKEVTDKESISHCRQI